MDTDDLSSDRTASDRTLARWGWPALAVAVALVAMRGLFSTGRVFYDRDLGAYYWPLRPYWVQRKNNRAGEPIWKAQVSSLTAILAYKHGIVFDERDMRGFVKTFMELVYAGGSDFRAIHGRVSDHVAIWRLASLRTPQLLTVQQVEEALAHLRRDAGRGTVAQRSLSTGVSPGFLVAVAGLLDGAIASVRQGSESPDRRSVAYVFGSRIYELRVVSAERATTAYDGRAISTVRTRFEIRTSETGARSRFELTAGAADDLAGVPLTIEWQPHWWLRVKLRLVGPADPAAGL